MEGCSVNVKVTEQNNIVGYVNMAVKTQPELWQSPYFRFNIFVSSHEELIFNWMLELFYIYMYIKKNSVTAVLRLPVCMKYR